MNRCSTGFVGVVKPRLGGINLQVVMIPWSGACSRRIEVLSLNYAVVACLVAMRAVGDELAWSALTISCLMLLS